MFFFLYLIYFHISFWASIVVIHFLDFKSYLRVIFTYHKLGQSRVGHLIDFIFAKIYFYVDMIIEYLYKDEFIISLFSSLLSACSFINIAYISTGNSYISFATSPVYHYLEFLSLGYWLLFSNYWFLIYHSFSCFLTLILSSLISSYKWILWKT